MTRAWLWNLDAELEFAGGRNYSPTKRTVEVLERRRQSCPELSGSDPVYLGDEPPERVRREARGPLVPWCVTWRAERFAARVGLPLVALVTADAAHALCSRRLLLAPEFSGTASRLFFDNADACAKFFRTRESDGIRFRAKREFSAQGRFQRVLELPLREEDHRYFEHAFRKGGVLVERELSVEREYSLHGMLVDGDAQFGVPCEQTTDAHGAPLSVERCERIPAAHRLCLEATAARVTNALAVRGYQGPFGIDFLVAEDGTPQLSEVNPRFTLGWAIGFGASAALVLERYVERFLDRRRYS